MVFIYSSLSFDWIYTVDWLSIISKLGTIVSSVFLAYLAWKSRKESQVLKEQEKVLEQRKVDATFNPVAEITVNNLPPYSSNDQTEIIVTNKGNCQMTTPGIYLTVSWMENAKILLDWGEDNTLVNNEVKRFKIRFPDPPLDRGEQNISVTVHCIHPLIPNQGLEWHEKFPISFM